jgi:hypothetical protein
VTKKVLVFLIAVLFLGFIGLWVLYFYAHTSTNKKNSILTFIPQGSKLIIRINETSENTNHFFANPVVQKCFRLHQANTYWNAIDSITSRNYKTADVLGKNTSYICFDSAHQFLILVDLGKKTNDHFIDQFLANSTSHRKIEKFKEGYKAFYPEPGRPVYYFIKHNVFALSPNPNFLLSSLNNVVAERSDSLITWWNDQSDAKISIWGKSGTELSVVDSFIPVNLLFNGWIDRLSDYYFLDIEVEKDQLEFTGQLAVDSLKMVAYQLEPADQKTTMLEYKPDTSTVTNQAFSIAATDSLGKTTNLVYTYHQLKDSANNNAQLLISNSQLVKYLFEKLLKDTSVQIISMADERIAKIAVMNWETAHNILPIIPITPDTGKLFATIYLDYFLVSNHTTTLLQIAPLVSGSAFIKNTVEKGTVVSGNKQKIFGLDLRSDYSFKLKDGVMKINCIIRLNSGK